MNKKAFTLIELLVVVLIIGILSAIALPKYELAVSRARYIQLIALANALRKGQDLYKLTNGVYASDISSLDIDLPSGTTRTSSTIYYNWGKCEIGATGYAYCTSNLDGIMYNDLRSRRECKVKAGESTENRARQICKSFGGVCGTAVDANGWLPCTLP